MAKKKDSSGGNPKRERKSPDAGKDGKDWRQKTLWPEENLQRNEGLFRGLFENHAAVELMVDPDTGNIVDANYAAAEFYGWTRDELRRMHIGDVNTLSPAEIGETLKTVKDRKRTHFEFRHRRADGSERDVEAFISAIEAGGKKVFHAIVHDITERKRAEKETYESEIRYRRLFESARDGILILDGESGRIVDANPFLLDLLGYTREEFIGKAVWEIGPLKVVIAGREKFQELQEKGFVRYEELPLETAKGQSIAVEFVSNGYLADHVKVIQCNIRDTTDRKRAEAEHRAGEEKFRSVFESANVGKSITLPSGEIHVNKTFCDMLGYEKKELEHKTWRDLTLPEDVPATQEILDSLLKGDRNTARVNKRYIHKNGTLLWADVSVALVRNGENQPLYFVTTIVDITDRKLAETALIHSHDLMRTIIEHSRSGIAVFDREMKCIYVSQRYLKEFGGMEKDVIGKSHYEIFPDLPEKLKDIHRRALTGEVLSAEDDPFVHEDGTVDWTRWECRPWHEADGSIGGIVINSEIITGRKRAEEALKRSQVLLNETQRISRTGGWEYDTATGRVMWTDEVYRIYGVTKDYDPSDPEQNIRFYAPEARDRVAEAFHRAFAEGKPYDLELPFVNACGERMWVRTVGQVERRDGKIVRIFGNIMDITEQRRQEEARRLSEEKFAKTFALSPITMAISSIREGTFVDVNESFLKISGYSREEIIGRSSRDINVFVDYKDRENLVNAVKANGRADNVEVRIRMKNGEIRDSLFSMGMVTVGGEPCLLSSLVDVTERNRADKARRLSEEKFVRTFQSAPIPMALAAIADKRISDVNEAFLEKTGYTREEAIGRTAGKLLLFVEGADRDELLETTLVNGKASKTNVKLRMKNGEIRNFYFSSALMNLVDGPHVLTSALDVTEQTRAEEALLLSEEKFSKAFNGSPISMSLSSISDGIFFDVNAAFLRFTGYSREEIGRTSLELGIFIDSVDREAILRDVVARGEVYAREIKTRTKAGKVEYCLMSMATVNVGAESYLLTSALEITERRQAETAAMENEAFIKAVLDHLPVGVAVNSVDPSVEFSYMNDNFPRFYGTSREKLADSDAFWEAAYEDLGFRAEIKAKVLADCASGNPDRMAWDNIPLTRKGAETRYISARNIPIPGKPLMISIVSDVTDRILAEEKIGKRLLYEEMLADISSRAMDIKDLSAFQNEVLEKMGKSLDVSRVYIFEYRRETDTGDNTFEWTAPGVSPQIDDFKNVPAEDLAVFIDELKMNRVVNYADVEEIPSKTGKMIMRRGDVKSVLIMPLFISGEFYGAMGFDECRVRREWPDEDVDLLLSIGRIVMSAVENETAETELRESEKRFRNLYENISIGFYQTTPSGRILMANPAMVNMLGFSSFEELMSRNLTDDGFSPEYPRREFQERIERDGEIRGLESRWKRKDGSTIYVRENARLVRAADGEILYYEGTAENITEKKLMEIQMTEQLEELRRWHTVTLGRETRLIGLKREVNELLASSGRALRYPGVESEE